MYKFQQWAPRPCTVTAMARKCILLLWRYMRLRTFSSTEIYVAHISLVVHRHSTTSCSTYWRPHGKGLTIGGAHVKGRHQKTRVIQSSGLPFCNILDSTRTSSISSKGSSLHDLIPHSFSQGSTSKRLYHLPMQSHWGQSCLYKHS